MVKPVMQGIVRWTGPLESCHSGKRRGLTQHTQRRLPDIVLPKVDEDLLQLRIRPHPSWSCRTARGRGSSKAQGNETAAENEHLLDYYPHWL